MSKAKSLPCDCLNHCGDDPWLKDGRSKPCARMLERQEYERESARQLAVITALRKDYGAENLYELIVRMRDKIELLQEGEKCLTTAYARGFTDGSLQAGDAT